MGLLWTRQDGVLRRHFGKTFEVYGVAVVVIPLWAEAW